MAQRSRRPAKSDVNELAAAIVSQATSDVAEMIAKAQAEGKNPAAVLLGHRGGLKGGKARAKNLSAKERKEIARKAARARWLKARSGQ